MKLRSKILLCAVLNLALLTLGLLAFTRVQFHTGLKSILLAPGQAHLRDLGDQVSDELTQTAHKDWNNTLANYAEAVRLDLFVTLNDGHLEGRSTKIDALPDVVLGELRPPRPFDPELPPPPRHPELGGRPGVFLVYDDSARMYWFGIRIPVQAPDWPDPMPGTLLVRTSSIFFEPFLFNWKPWLGCIAGLVLVTLACWIPFIRGLTRSVRQITGAAELIAQGQFETKTGVNRRDEIGHLSDALHRMAAQLNGLVTGQKRFLGDIAHELCAPISRAQMAVGILEERAEPAQKRHVDTVQEEVAQMSTLVNELLQFSKAGFETRRAALQPVRVSEVAARVFEREGKCELLSGGDLRVIAEPDGLFRALSNVVRNARRYAGEHGPVTISARADGEHVLISVADEGPGLPEEALERVFTPFYRVDESRSRESGGVGLGLSIVKSCVEASGGTVACRNRIPKGLEVVIRLSRAQSSA